MGQLGNDLEKFTVGLEQWQGLEAPIPVQSKIRETPQRLNY